MICSDPDQLVQLVLKERGMNPHVVLSGMNDGKGFCKVAVVFLDTEADKENNGRAKCAEVQEHIEYY